MRGALRVLIGCAMIVSASGAWAVDGRPDCPWTDDVICFVMRERFFDIDSHLTRAERLGGTARAHRHILPIREPGLNGRSAAAKAVPSIKNYDGLNLLRLRDVDEVAQLLALSPRPASGFHFVP